MIERLLKNPVFRRYFPFLAGFVFIALFVSLGRWQLERAAEKEALLALFENDGDYVRPKRFDTLNEFDRIEVFGQYLTERQILIDNIPLEGGLGYFVVTPFQPSGNSSLLLINRGWLPKPGPANRSVDVAVDSGFTTIRGLVWHLPRVGIRPGEAFEGSADWPRIAVYPTIDEVESELEETLLPVVLLLSPESDNGYVRQWQPNVSGPTTHYSYAFQWFAMAATVIAIAAWHLRKSFHRDTSEN